MMLIVETDAGNILCISLSHSPAPKNAQKSFWILKSLDGRLLFPLYALALSPCVGKNHSSFGESSASATPSSSLYHSSPKRLMRGSRRNL